MDVRFCARQEPLPRGIDCTLRVLQLPFWALSRAPQKDPCFLLTKTYMDVGYTEAIHFDGLSATLPCVQPLGTRLGKRAERAFYVQVAVPMRLPDAGGLPRDIFHPVQDWVRVGLP